MSDDHPHLCPRCRDQGKVFSFLPLVALGVAIVSFGWLYLVFTGKHRFSDIVSSRYFLHFLATFVLGPAGLWVFISRGVISREGWFVECPRCREARQHDDFADDESPGHMIETSISCPDCEYDLRYQSVGGRCPECGSRILAPKALARLSEARKERRSGLVPVGIAAGVVGILLLVALVISPGLAGCIGFGCLGVLGVLAGVQGVVTRQVDIRGMRLTGWLAVFFASGTLLIGLIIVAVLLVAILG